MKNKILIISENQYLNTIYTVNLEVYLAAVVVQVSSVDAAIETLKNDKKFDLIITLEFINKEESGVAIGKYLKSNVIKTPLIVIGELSEELIDGNVFEIPSRFEIQSLLKTCAQILNITPKQMAELNVGSHYPVSITLLFDFPTSPCHLFTYTQDKYKELATPGAAIGNIFNNLYKDGILQIFVYSKDRLLLINKITLFLINKMTTALKCISENASVEDKVEALNDGYEFAAANLFASEEIKEQMLEIGLASSNIMKDIISKEPSLNNLLSSMLNNKGGYIYSHSMIISFVMTHLIKKTEFDNEEQIKKINFSIFFHDIFLAPVYLKRGEFKIEPDLLKNKKIDDKTKFSITNHAFLGAELVKGFPNCPKGAEILVREHHGTKNGKGLISTFPDDASPLTKMFLIAEIFTEEFMRANDSNIPFNKILLTLKLGKKFESSPSYGKIVQSLANIPI